MPVQNPLQKRSNGPSRNKGSRSEESRQNGSKYARKGKGGKRKAVTQLKRGEPVFTYYVAGTDVEATKTPCEHTAEDRAERKPSRSSLGTWRDPRSNHKCKVDRVRNKPKQEVVDGA